MDTFRVLLVDDERELVTTMVERLSYRGVQADYALNGSEALTKLNEGDFDIVVLDLKMPGMSGQEVLDTIKLQHPGIPILLITGRTAPEQKMDTIHGGAYDLLMKPVNLKDLIEKMREAIANK